MKTLSAIGCIVILAASAQTLQAQWTTGHLSVPRENISGISVGSRAVFAGGDGNNGLATRVDIYDYTTATWDTMTLLHSTIQISGTWCNGKVYVPGDGSTDVGEINIIDLPAKTIASDTMPHIRGYVATVATGGKVFYAGGQDDIAVSYIVDIYDTQTKQWSTAHLSVARRLIAAATAGSKVVFAGGESSEDGTRSNAVDIYDMSDGTWTTATLSQAKTHSVAAAAGTKILIAGGDNATEPTNRVDIYNVVSGTWSIDSLSIARHFLAATTLGNKIYFGGGTDGNSYFDRVDIYNADSGKWSQQSLCLARYVLSAATAGNQLLFTGGIAPGGRSDTVDVFTDSSVVYTGVTPVANSSEWRVFPNPAYTAITISGITSPEKINEIIITDLSGKTLFSSENISDKMKIDVQKWSNGIYFISTKSRGLTTTRKFIVEH